MFIHLRTHSYFSFLRGTASPQELVAMAGSLGMHSLALTDHHSMTGVIEFYDACKSNHICPILGLDINITFPNLSLSQPTIISLLAVNTGGWTNLCKLGSLAADNDLVPFSHLEENSDGLICLTGGYRGALRRFLKTRQVEKIPIYLSTLKDLFADRLYIELQIHAPEDHEICVSASSIAARYKVPTVATHDVHYLKHQEEQLQKLVTSIRTGHEINTLDDELAAPPKAFFRTEGEMSSIFANFPNALERTNDIAERCQVELPLGTPHYPELEFPPGFTPRDILRSKAEAGARRLYVNNTQMIPPHIQDRLDNELTIINQLGYAPLFLIMEEILNFARAEGIPFSSRGSAASSLVAHCLGITSPDPIRLNLYFERFLNPARATPPDIDTDLCSVNRDRVIKHVYSQYGEDRVATICTINRFRPRSSLREVAKAYGLNTSAVNHLTDSLPHLWFRPGSRSEKHESPYKELAHRFSTPTHLLIFKDSERLIDFPHHLSVHPGGIVISPSPICDWAPTKLASKGVRITQFDMSSVERMGLVKIDLLGIRGLTVIGDIAESLITIPSTSADYISNRTSITNVIESIPEVDADVSDLLYTGKTIGCFQIESPGMRATLREIQARTIDDIMAALALFRPGPLLGGFKADFVRRHLHLEDPQYLHPALESVLKDTYGVILYQEQVLRLASELGGMSITDADLLRRAMSHFDPGEQMKTLKAKFLRGALERHAIPTSIAEQIWELMAAFAGYGFPKAHAASYSLLSWRSAWCKAHFPAQFIAAVLANWGGYYSQRVYLSEARRLGLSVQPPLINFAQREFSVSSYNDRQALFMGLDQVRDLTKNTQLSIIRHRPFTSLVDFLVRVDPHPQEARNLIMIGSLEGFGTIPDLLEQMENGLWGNRQFPLFPLDSSENEDWSISRKADAQSDILGTSLISHPLEMAAKTIASAGAITTAEAAAHLGQKVRIAGIRQTLRRGATARGAPIYLMALEDLEGYLDVVMTSTLYTQCKIDISRRGAIIVEGEVDFNQETHEAFIRASRIWKI